MENTEEDSTTKKSASPLGEFKRVHVIDLTEDTDGDKAKTKGGKSAGGGKTGKGHSSGNIRMKLASGEGGSQLRSSKPDAMRDSVQELTMEICNLKDPMAKFASTCVTKHKRKLSEGECEVTTDKNISDEKGSLPNESAIHVYEVKALNAQKNEADPLAAKKNDVGQDATMIRSFDLNDPLADEDEGGESGEKPKGNEDSPPTQELQGLDLLAYEAEQHMAIKEIDLESLPEKKQKLGTSEVDSFAVEKTAYATGDAKIFKFDLNELPIEVDKNWF